MSLQHFRRWQPSEDFLLPPSPREWLEAGHLVYFILDIVEELDLSKILARYDGREDTRGRNALHPVMMVALVVYGYCVGIRSSRRLERATYEDVAVRVLTGGNHPDHVSISEFRRRFLPELRELFVVCLRMCQKAGLVKLGDVALDGTKVLANASKHKAMGYDRMLKTERELEAEVRDLLASAEATDRQEDQTYGRGKRGDEVPEELKRRETRLARIREAKARLEAEAAAAKTRERQVRAEEAAQAAAKLATDAPEHQAAEQRADETRKQADAAAELARRKAEEAKLPEPDLRPRDADQLPSHQVKARAEGQPDPKAQMNFTDPDSRIMKTGGEFVQGYNAQAVVDAAAQIIVAQALTNQSPDPEHFRPMLAAARENCGAAPQRASADSGYWSEDNAKYAADNGIDAYIAVERLKHGERPPSARGRPPRNLDAKGKMRRKLRTKSGRQTYSRRKTIVEPVFGQMKQGQGFRRFLLRGLDKVRSEWALMCTSHNLLKLFRATRKRGQAPGGLLTPAPGSWLVPAWTPCAP